MIEGEVMPLVGDSSVLRGKGIALEGRAPVQSSGVVTDLSDLPPCPPTEKHKPVEAEANLASLFLAKGPYTLKGIVPDVEDSDFGYFEQVLMSDPKA